MDYINQANVGGTVYTVGMPHVYKNDKSNLQIETTSADQYTENDKIKGGKINIEAASDIQIKPGDDIALYSHHRKADNQKEVSIKTLNGSKLSRDGSEIPEYPVDLQINAANINLTTKDKSTYISEVNKDRAAEGKGVTNDAANVLNIEVNSAKNTRGYLKVRAQAIDLRSETHGGIALQPKGRDSELNINKIKFEHGGGDGLEFGTFNTEKTSIFTDEYRFNKDGVWKMAERFTVASDKAEQNDPTTSYKYLKNNSVNNAAKAQDTEKTFEGADDFYDFIDTENPQTTTEAIIKTSSALNNRNVETALSSKKNLKISTANEYKIVASTAATNESALTFTIDSSKERESYTKDELKSFISGTTKMSDYIGTATAFNITDKTGQFQVVEFLTPKVSIESEEEVDLTAKVGDVAIVAGDCIKCEAPEIRLNALNADKTGGMVNFGATQDIVFITNKLTAGLKVEAPTTPTKIKQALQNNSSDTVYWDSTNSVFRIPLKKIYIDAAHTTELDASNYSEGIPIYFADGTRVPADYTCYVGFISESGGIYTTDIYVVATKGSEAVTKKKLFQKKVATYTGSSDAQVMGSTRTTYADDQTNYEQIKGLNFIEFEFSDFDGTGFDEVEPGQYAVDPTNTIDLVDIFTLINYFKTGDGQASGPWAQL